MKAQSLLLKSQEKSRPETACGLGARRVPSQLLPGLVGRRALSLGCAHLATHLAAWPGGVPWEPQNEWFIMEKILLKIKMDDFGGPISGNLHMGISLSFEVNLMG